MVVRDERDRRAKAAFVFNARVRRVCVLTVCELDVGCPARRLYFGTKTWGDYSLAAGKPNANVAPASASASASAKQAGASSSSAYHSYPGGDGNGTFAVMMTEEDQTRTPSSSSTTGRWGSSVHTLDF